MFIGRMSVICYNVIEDDGLSCTKCYRFRQSGIKWYSSFLGISYDKIEIKHYSLEMLLPSCKFQNVCSVHIQVNIIMADLRRYGSQFSAVLCKTCRVLLFILEQPIVGTGTNSFKTGPKYDIIKHLYIIGNWEYVYLGAWLILKQKCTFVQIMWTETKMKNHLSSSL